MAQPADVVWQEPADYMSDSDQAEDDGITALPEQQLPLLLQPEPLTDARRAALTSHWCTDEYGNPVCDSGEAYDAGRASLLLHHPDGCDILTLDDFSLEVPGELHRLATTGEVIYAPSESQLRVPVNLYVHERGQHYVYVDFDRDMDAAVRHWIRTVLFPRIRDVVLPSMGVSPTASHEGMSAFHRIWRAPVTGEPTPAQSVALRVAEIVFNGFPAQWEKRERSGALARPAPLKNAMEEEEEEEDVPSALFLQPSEMRPVHLAQSRAPPTAPAVTPFVVHAHRFYTCMSRVCDELRDEEDGTQARERATHGPHSG